MEHIYKEAIEVTELNDRYGSSLELIKDSLRDGKYDLCDIELVYDDRCKEIYIFNKGKNKKLYRQSFTTLAISKKMAKYLGLDVVKRIKTQVNFFNVDGSKRGYKNAISNKTKGVS